jgi:hypothetical protein
MKEAHLLGPFANFSKHMPTYVRVGITTFLVDHCLLVQAYDTRVDALVDTQPGPTDPTNIGINHLLT